MQVLPLRSKTVATTFVALMLALSLGAVAGCNKQPEKQEAPATPTEQAQPASSDVTQAQAPAQEDFQPINTAEVDQQAQDAALKDAVSLAKLETAPLHNLDFTLQDGASLTLIQAQNPEVEIFANAKDAAKITNNGANAQVNGLKQGTLTAAIPNGWAGKITIAGPGSVALDKVIFSGDLIVQGATNVSVSDSSTAKFIGENIKDAYLSGAVGRNEFVLKANTPKLEALTVSSNNRVTIINEGGSIEATAVGGPNTVLKALGGDIAYTSNEDETTEFIIVNDKHHHGPLNKNKGGNRGQGQNGQKTMLEAPNGTVTVAFTGGTCPAGTNCEIPNK